MESKAQEKQKKEEEDVVIKMEETEDTKALTGPPTLDEMVAGKSSHLDQ